jgi:exodeoxyribonuclease V alpha subunit
VVRLAGCGLSFCAINNSKRQSMAARTEEIEGVLLEVRVRKGEWFAAEVKTSDGCISVSGVAEPSDIEEGGTYRFFGRRSEWVHPRFKTVQKQFKFTSFTVATPSSKAGVIAYLTKIGDGNGMGSVTVEKLWKAYGSETVATIRMDPTCLRRYNSRITEGQQETIVSILREQKWTEAAAIEVAGLLNGQGFPKAVAGAAIKKWGNQAARTIRRDPYKLIEFKGVGFKMADALWLTLGNDPGRLRRQTLAIWDELKNGRQKEHTWQRASVLMNRPEKIAGRDARPRKAIELGIRLNSISRGRHYASIEATRTKGIEGPIDPEGDVQWLASASNARAEKRLAKKVGGMIDRQATRLPIATKWPEACQIDATITGHQVSELEKALSGRLGILSGSPGTGKTYVVARLIKELCSLGYAESIIAGCPTGKAAVRLTEVLHEAEVNLKARTWHSHLGWGNDETDFAFNDNQHWPEQIIIGDETSMVDMPLMGAVFAAAKPNAHMLLVGDVNQLSPVGGGAPMRDMINSGAVGFGKLTKIERNEGRIPAVCAAIRDALPWPSVQPGQLDNFKILEERQPAGQLASLDLLMKACKANGFDPVWDVQVMVAVNEKSKLSRKDLNQRLQVALNPMPAIPGRLFRLNDKVICLKNSKYDKTRVSNGEIGKVISIVGNSMQVELPAPHRLVSIPLYPAKQGEKVGGKNWDLGYAISVHKSQGSEFRIAVVMIDSYPGAKMVCSREWLYTAISRAKEKCFLIGSSKTAEEMCRKVVAGKRKTFLRELIIIDEINHLF